jgi:hypothetical protein
MNAEEPLTTLEVKLERVITVEGKMAFKMTTPEVFSSVEVLGLLEAAKLLIFNNMNGNCD